ncbi:MAG TPA: pyridoxamine 5'-phosphate oxidase [Lentimicrobium sp.]|nr:pyridoxamine 5'-phosphate oxidase [Lentimicrobium sp.]
MNVAEIRRNYILNRLDESDTGSDPIFFFRKWLDEAIKAQSSEPTAMILSTADEKGRPSSRVVLLKGIENVSFRFFTNYNSLKGKQIHKNPFGSILFFWPELERQVRIQGKIVKISDEESDEYFNSRPLESRISAMISPQSEVIPNRAYLEKLMTVKVAELGNQPLVTRPKHWGGYDLNPTSIEFWQGRESRLHDRILFLKIRNKWIRERLAP